MGTEYYGKGRQLRLKLVMVVNAYMPHTVSFPKPGSPLLDIHTIVGDPAKLNTLVVAFKREVTSKGFSPWKSLEWFQTD